MAENQNVNKVVYGNSTLIDLTNDTVEPPALVTGYTAHDRSGASIQGSLDVYDKDEIDDLLDEKQDVLTFDVTPTNGSQNPVTSDGVYDAIAQSTAKTEITMGVSSYTTQVTYYMRKAIKYANRVTIQLSCAFDINLPTDRMIASVPDGYRPSANVGLPAIIITDNGTVMCASAIMTTSGEIKQALTGYCRKIYVSADYFI